MTRSKVYEHKNAEYRAEAIEYLRELFPPGTEVRTVVKHVTRSGMGRVIDVLAIQQGKGSDPVRIVSVGHHVARVLDWSYDNDHGGVYVGGCGMDMCFHLVYTLSRALYAASDGGERSGYVLDSRPL
jgi:predicted HAD superfamily phosphohydrolase